MDELSAFAWAIFLGANIGDLFTTYVGLSRFEHIDEVGDWASPLHERFGFGALIALKTGLLAAVFVVWKVVPASGGDVLVLYVGVLSAGATVHNARTIRAASATQ